MAAIAINSVVAQGDRTASYDIFPGANGTVTWAALLAAAIDGTQLNANSTIGKFFTNLAALVTAGGAGISVPIVLKLFEQNGVMISLTGDLAGATLPFATAAGVGLTFPVAQTANCMFRISLAYSASS